MFDDGLFIFFAFGPLLLLFSPPLGPAFRFAEKIKSLRLSSDSTTLMIEGDNNRFWLWKLDPRPLAGEPREIRHWARVVTGLEQDANRVAHDLDPAAWARHKGLAGPAVP